jgi:hypothetical protein
MSKHVKNQHYVPQFLLKNFSSRERKFIWAYDKEEKYNFKDQIKERVIKSVASEDFFYDEIRNSKIGSLEYVLQEIETQTAPIIKGIIESKTIKSLCIDDRKALSLFIIVQHLRTKGHLNETEYLMDVFEEQILQKFNVNIERIDVRKVWFSFIEDSKVFSDIIMNKVWVLCESDRSFYISDNPVVLQNSTNTNELIGSLGLDSYGIEIYLPLSPSLTLCMFCEKMFQGSGYNLKYMDNFICPSESIENLNSLQVAYSQRFIFSHKDEFDSLKIQLGNMEKVLKNY